MNNYDNKLVEISGIADCFPDNSKTFKVLSVGDAFIIPSSKPDILNIMGSNSSIKITGTKIIPVPKSQGADGKVLTGLVLLTEGEVSVEVKYLSDAPGQPVQSACFSKLFSGWIMLDEDYDFDSEYRVTPFIEDVYITQLDKRNLYINVMFLINAFETVNQ